MSRGFSVGLFSGPKAHHSLFQRCTDAFDESFVPTGVGLKPIGDDDYVLAIEDVRTSGFTSVGPHET